MAEQRIVVISQVTVEHAELTLEELCEACAATQQVIVELVNLGALEPAGTSRDTWRFDLNQVRRVRKAQHLLQDLEINLAGAALAMDLMDELETLYARIELLEKHLEQKKS